MDVFSSQAALFMAVLRPLLPPTPQARVLEEWDLRYDPGSRGAALFERFYRELLVLVFGAVCGEKVLRFLLDETGLIVDFYANFDAVLLRPDSAWYGNEGRDALFRRAAERALAGPAPTWGEINRLTMRHLLLGGRVPSWLGFDHAPVSLAGGRATIHQGQIYRAGGRQTSFAPSYRLITDLGEPAAYTTLIGGPSDRRFSRWYTCGVADALAGRFKRLSPGGASAE
jgi:penicillin amidase